jgi:hypothetical protein
LDGRTGHIIEYSYLAKAKAVLRLTEFAQPPDAASTYLLGPVPQVRFKRRPYFGAQICARRLEVSDSPGSQDHFEPHSGYNIARMPFRQIGGFGAADPPQRDFGSPKPYHAAGRVKNAPGNIHLHGSTRTFRAAAMKPCDRRITMGAANERHAKHRENRSRRGLSCLS